MEGGSPISTYEFIDIERLDRYLNGAAGQEDLAEYVAVHYADASAKPAQPLARLNDLRTDDEPKALVSVLADAASVVPVQRAATDVTAAARSAAGRDWLEAGLLGTGIVLASSVLDKRAFRFADEHGQSTWLKRASTAGNAIPWLAIGGAGLAALDGSDPVRQRTGFAAAEAGATAFVAATGLKYAVGRARPRTGEGNSSFDALSKDDRFNSFPSRHAAVAWAVATPFAQEYGSVWPYAAAAFTSFARVASGEHWVSDSVAASLLGYGIGRIFWESARATHKDAPRLMLSPKGVAMEWAFQ
jgi:membrane-associated phospholipid phosphatase